MYKLPKQTRDEIVAFLQTAMVPAAVGSVLINIAQALSKLEEIKEEVKDEKPS
jgi:hypothetical protein